MAGFIPAPTPPTRIGIEGQPLLTGDVMLRPGVGLIGRQDGDVVQFDSRMPDTLQPGGFFLAGEMVPVLEAGRFAQIQPTGATRLRAMEVNCRIGPAGVDAGNYRALYVHGSVSGSQTLPLSVAGQRRFTFNDVVASLIAPHGGGSSGDLASDCTAVGTWVTLDAPLANVQAFTYRMGKNYTTTDQNEGRVRVFEILDADLNVVGRGTLTKWFDGAGTAGGLSIGNGLYLCFLDYAVGLDAGKPYLFAVRGGEPLLTGSANLPVYFGGSNTAQQTPYIPAGEPTPIWKVPSAASNAGLSWPQLKAAGLVVNEPAGSTGAPGGIGVDIYGAPGSPLLLGDVIVDVVSLGTGGTTGAIDTNVRFMWELA